MPRDYENEDYWIPLADLMTGMMLIFLLLSVALILKTRNVVDSYTQIKQQIYSDLNKEFKIDLPKWDATLNKNDLSIRFNEPSIMFATGSSDLKPQFKFILADFFPRYIKILSKQQYREYISQIRIDGYTSSLWNTKATPDQRYFFNMDLSQKRTTQVLQYVYGLENNELTKQNRYQDFIRNYVTANGLSSSHLIYNKDGTENIKASQRVEFKVDLNADKKIEQISKGN